MSQQTTGPATISGPVSDTRSFSHTGAEVGDSNVELNQNTTGREDVVLRWTMPKKYNRVAYAAGKHYTHAELRHRVNRTSHSGTSVDVDGDADLVPVAGELEVDDQPFAAVRVVNTTTGNELSVDSINYGANTLTLATDPAGDDLALFPVMNEGYVKYVAENQFDQRVGPLDPWGIPSHVFSDFEQDNNETRIHLVGAGSFKRNESLALVVDSPRQVVWEDSDYPEGYVSRWQQRVDVSL